MHATSTSVGSSLNNRIMTLLPRVRYRRATSEGERAAIFRMRHDAYVREGAITQRPDGMFNDHVDEQPNCLLVGVYVDDRLAGSIRLSVTLPISKRLPTAEVFPETLLPEIEAGMRIVDPTRFVGDRDVSRDVPELPYLTLRAPWMAMEHFRADLMLAAVRPEHQAFYKRLWGNVTLCEPRLYPSLAKPVALTVLNFAAAKATVLRRHPYFQSSAEEREALFGPSFEVPAATPIRLPAPANPAALVGANG